MVKNLFHRKNLLYRPLLCIFASFEMVTSMKYLENKRLLSSGLKKSNLPKMLIFVLNDKLTEIKIMDFQYTMFALYLHGR